MAISLFFIGLGAIHWAKTLMPDTEVIAERHEFRSPDSERKDFVTAVKEGAAASGLGRRSLIKRSLGAALGLSALSPLILLRDLGPLPGKELEKTTWKSGTYLVTWTQQVLCLLLIESHRTSHVRTNLRKSDDAIVGHRQSVCL